MAKRTRAAARQEADSTQPKPTTAEVAAEHFKALSVPLGEVWRLAARPLIYHFHTIDSEVAVIKN